MEHSNSDEPGESALCSETYRYDADIGGYLAPSETFRSHMNPMIPLRQLSASTGLTAADREIAIVMFQARLLTLLDRFLNAFAVPVVPLDLPPSRRVRALLADLRELAGLLGDGSRASLAESHLRALETRVLTVPRAAEILASGYRLFDAAREDIPTTAVESDPGLTFNDDHYRGKRESWILRMRDEVVQSLSADLAGFWIHGSMSTLDYCDFSDLDTLLIVRRETVLDARKLASFRQACYPTTRYLYLVDPYQHHGHFAFTEIDQLCYPQTHFPVKLFEYSTRLVGGDPIRFEAHEDAQERIRPVWGIVQRIRSAVASNAIPTDPYSVKCLLSYVLLLPTLVLQARGIHCYKRDSFELARSHFTPSEWTAVEEASALRREWRLTPDELGALSRQLSRTGNPHLWSAIRRATLLRRPRLSGLRLTSDFMKKGARFADAALRTAMEIDG